MAVTTQNGKLLLGPSMSKAMIDDMVEEDVEDEENYLMKSEKLDGNEILSNH